MASCPVCSAQLAGKVYDRVAFSECPQCAGVWFFEEDLRQMESENVRDLDQIDLIDVPIKAVQAPSGPIACPMCARAMGQFHFMIQTPVLLHRCESCEGLWIEHGELTQMASAIEAANKPATPEELALANKAKMDYQNEVANWIMPPSKDGGTQAPRTESAAEIAFDKQHEATMARYDAAIARNNKIFGVFWLLSRHIGRPMWMGW